MYTTISYKHCAKRSSHSFIIIISRRDRSIDSLQHTKRYLEAQSGRVRLGQHSSQAELAVEEGLLQQRQQLLAVHVARMQPQRLARELVRLLEVALTETNTQHSRADT